MAALPDFAPDINPNAMGQNAYNATQDTPPPPPPVPKAPVAAPLPVAPPAPPVAPPPAPKAAEPNFAPEAPPPPGRAAMSQPNFGQNMIDQQAKLHQDYLDKIAAVTKELGGEKFDNAGGLPGVAQNAYMEIMNRPADRAKFLQDQGYESKVISPPGVGPMTVWRVPGTDTWQPVRGNSVDSGTVGRAIPDTAAALAQAIAAIYAPEGVLAQMVAGGATGAAVQGAKEIATAKGGYNSGSLAENAGEIGKSGAINALVPGVAPLAVKGPLAIADKLASMGEGSGANAAAGPATSSIADMFRRYMTTPQPYARGTEAGKALMRASTEEGAPTPTIGQLESAGQGGGGLVAARQQQVLATNPGLRERVTVPQQDWLYKTTMADRNALTGGQNAPELTDQQIGDILNLQKGDVSANLPNPGVSMTEGGKALQQGILGKKDVFGNVEVPGFLPKAVDWRSGKYEDLLNTAKDNTYDLAPLQEKATEMEKGLPMHGAPEQTGIDEATGAPVLSPTTVEVGQQPVGSVQNIIDKVKSLDPNARLYPAQDGYPETGAYEGLKAINTQLGDMIKQYPAAGSVADRAEYNQAKQLYNVLGNVIENPTAANQGYATKLLAASNANKFVNKVLDHPVTQAIMNSENPAELMKILQPGNSQTLTMLKRVSPTTWPKVQDAFMTQLQAEPEKIGATLDAWRKDPQGLNTLMAPADQEAARKWGSQISSINNSDLAKLQADTNMANRLPSILGKDPNALAAAVDKAGGPNSGFGRTARAGVMQYLLDKATVNYAGRPTVDPGAFSDAASKLIDSGALKGIFTPAELQTMANRQIYAKGVDMGGMDTGTSLMKASMAKGIAEWIHPYKWLNSLGGVGFNAIQARTMTSKAASNVLYGAGIGSTVNPGARAGVAAFGAALNNLRTEEPNMEGGKTNENP